MTVRIDNRVTECFVVRSSCTANGEVFMTVRTAESLSACRQLTVFLDVIALTVETIDETLQMFFHAGIIGNKLFLLK